MTCRVDLHAHTTASDGKHTAEQMIKKAAAEGLQAFAITDHNTVRGITEIDAEDILEQHGLHFVPGCELSFMAGHFLVYGIPLHQLALLIQQWKLREGRADDPRKLPAVKEVLQECIDAGGVIIAAHPCLLTGIMSVSFPVLSQLIDERLVHGFEVENHDLSRKLPGLYYKYWQRQMKTAAAALSVSKVKNSDAHSKGHVGALSTKVPIFDSSEQLLQVIKTRPNTE